MSGFQRVALSGSAAPPGSVEVDQVGGGQWLGDQAVGDRRPHPEPLGGLAQLSGTGQVAHQDNRRLVAQLAHRGQGTLRRAARTENDRLLDPGQPGFLQRRDHADDVRVVCLPASRRAGWGKHQRIRGPDGLGQRRYLIRDGQGHPLERHRQRQAGPLGSHAVDYAR